MDEIELVVSKYLDEHFGDFDKYEKQAIMSYVDCIGCWDEMVPDLVREVYDELGLLADEDNIYLGFIEMLDDIFDIKDKNIVEVGGGVIPRLGKRIASRQTEGKITVYDPRLSVYERDLERMHLVRDKFTKDTDVKDVDLLIGFMPCEATHLIISSATENDIDFMIALCEGGTHGDVFDYYDSSEEWLDSTIYYAKKRVEVNNMGRVKEKKLLKYRDPYPVIYNSRFS